MRNMCRLLLLFIILSLSLTALMQEATEESPTTPRTSSVVGGDDAALRDFIIRSLGGSVPGSIINVTIGALPADLPLTLPLPTDVTILSSIARPISPEAATSTFYDIALETDAQVQSVVDFYKQTFDTQNWTLLSETVTPAAAFIEETSAYLTACNADNSVFVSLNLTDTPTQPTSLLINVQSPAESYACQSIEAQNAGSLFTLIPPLALPPDVTLIANMGGGLSYYAPNRPSNSVSAVLTSPRPLAEIATAYNAQLAAAGWQLIAEEATTRTALSLWTITDASGQTWQGSLLLLADTVPNQYNALIYVQE